MLDWPRPFRLEHGAGRRIESLCGVSVVRIRALLAPLGDAAFDVTVHIVMNDFGRLGIAYVETDAAEGDRATIIENILTG
jgi:hypothetical protein